MRRLLLFVALLELSTFFVSGQQPAQETDPYENVQKLDLKAGMHAPQVIHHSGSIAIPKEARERNMSERCLLSLVVDDQGTPRDIRLIRCIDSSFAEPSLRSIAEYKFKPATTADGKPLAVRISFQISFVAAIAINFSTLIRYTFLPPPDSSPEGPNSSGVYPFSASISPPQFLRFSDQGYGQLAFGSEGSSPCGIELTIDAKGKPGSPAVTQCDGQQIEEAAIASLMASHFKAGLINGKPVSVRILNRLEYGGTSAAH